MATTIVGLFNTMDDAQHTVQALIDSGFHNNDISVIARDERGKTVQQNAVGDSSQAVEGAGAGAVGGTVIGGAIGLLIGAGLLAIPGIGPVLAAGPLAAAIGTATATAGAGALGAGVGAATGGLVGGLVGVGVPEEQARSYAQGVERGNVLVSVSTDEGRAASTGDLMRRYGALNLESHRRSDADDDTADLRDYPNADAVSDSGYLYGDYARGQRSEPADDVRSDYARGLRDYSNFENDFRSHHSATYTPNPQPYETHEPAYRYGYNLASDSNFQGNRWEDVEQQARRSWEQDRPGTWNEFKEKVRYAWERGRGLRA